MNKTNLVEPGKTWIPPLRRKVRGSGRDDKVVESTRNFVHSRFSLPQAGPMLRMTELEYLLLIQLTLSKEPTF